MRPAAPPTVILAALALALSVSPAADAKRRTDCERPRSATLVETALIRVYDIPRGSQRQGTRSTSTYACRKGSRLKPLLLFDDGDGPGGAFDFAVLGRRVAMTLVGCDPTGFGCGSDARLLDLRTRRSLYGPAEPAGAAEADWQAVHALPAASGALVYSARSPFNPSAERPVLDSRIVVVGADRVSRELDRGAGVEAETLAVAHRAGLPSLFTWRSGGQLRSAEL